MIPILINPKLSVYNKANWDIVSLGKLQTARMYIGIVSVRNPLVHYAKPKDLKNPIERMIWDLAISASINAEENSKLDARITHFYLRQDGIGKQIPSWGSGTNRLNRYLSLGPFNNVGGGDVPKGPNTYIDFYGK